MAQPTLKDSHSTPQTSRPALPASSLRQMPRASAADALRPGATITNFIATHSGDIVRIRGRNPASFREMTQNPIAFEMAESIINLLEGRPNHKPLPSRKCPGACTAPVHDQDG